LDTGWGQTPPYRKITTGGVGIQGAANNSMLNISGVSVAFDGVKTINNQSLMLQPAEMRHLRPERCGQDHRGGAALDGAKDAADESPARKVVSRWVTYP